MKERHYPRLRVKTNHDYHPVNLTIKPFTPTKETKDLVMVTFEDVSDREKPKPDVKAGKPPRDKDERLQDLTAKLLHIQEMERKSVANDIHDGLLSELAAVSYSLEAKILSLEKANHSLAPDLRKVFNIHKGTMKEARRIMNRLRPSILDELGLIPAAKGLCREFQMLYPQIQLDCQLEPLEQEIPSPIKFVIFRVMQEALTNSARHGRGTLAKISLGKGAGRIELMAQDNGQGFDFKINPKSVGLESMRERVEISGGIFKIESVIGVGTTIRASWPVPLP